ncbi:MAG: hypothetical protein NVSMB24_38970 [Mucilaginibacter sp.]
MKKILIIEDDRDMVDILKMLFAVKGFALVFSENMISLDEIYHINPDVIIMDDWLRDGFGSQLCERLKENRLTTHIPVILTSAVYHLDQTAAQCNADAFLEKPFELKDLTDMVHLITQRDQVRKVYNGFHRAKNY